MALCFIVSVAILSKFVHFKAILIGIQNDDKMDKENRKKDIGSLKVQHNICTAVL